MKTYPVLDCVTLTDKKSLDLLEIGRPLINLGGGVRLSPTQEIKAFSTGEKRPPKKGEWYLSGAVVGAYRAPNDLSTSFHIAKLCITETEKITRIVKMSS